MAATTMRMQTNLNELDAMLQDLSRAQYSGKMEVIGEDVIPPERPPPPKGYESDNFLTVPKSTKTTRSLRSSNKDYSRLDPQFPLWQQKDQDIHLNFNTFCYL